MTWTGTGEQPATVFVVDDDPDLRRALVHLMDSVGLAVETFDSSEAFLAVHDPERPGCLLLDVRMPGMGGLGLQAQLVAQNSPLPVLIITGHGDVPVAVSAIQQGAVHFIEKPFSNQMLLERVRETLVWDCSARAERAKQRAVRACIDDLTPREAEVMALIVNGQSSKMIAGKLDISTRTVESHRATLMRKMGVTSLAALVTAAVVGGMVRISTNHPPHNP